MLHREENTAIHGVSPDMPVFILNKTQQMGSPQLLFKSDKSETQLSAAQIVCTARR